ncbi:DUF4362 domain-containing protein [Paenibacillus jilunlii]|uniref:DUF4362 domain-containing protein n=1 Tax=Paenibacillus jilunlii TaxID=682956 RepID=A0A1G9RKU5_9BACL|nr:DUF4362 domain-containing protein [Paenibacillus jilunlii]SDM23843.1 protein of unknown function [Paenibacillus jilunlii]
MSFLKSCIVLLLISLFTVACSKSISSNEAAEEGYVVYGNGGVLNYELFAQFLDKVNKSESAIVKFAKYTDEGDPIFHTLEFDDDSKDFTYTYDSRDDEFGKKEKVTTKCRTLSKDKNGTFGFIGCENDEVGKRFNAKEQIQ